MNNPFTNDFTPKEPIDMDKIKNTKGVFRSVLIAVLIVIALIVSSGCFVVTEQNQYSLIQQFGKIVSVRTEAGLSYKLPFIQTVRTVPQTALLYDLPVSDVITKDKKTMVADSFVLWEIADPILFSQTLNGNITNAEARISAIVYNSMKNVISSMSQTDIISGRDKLASAIYASIGTSLSQYGINMIAVETKQLDLPDDNKNAVYERMISERNNIAASYQAEGESEAKKIRSETDMTISIKTSEAKASAEKIIAEGEAEYMKILAGAYGDTDRAEFYTFVRSLDAAKESLKGENKTLILDKDSPLAQIFYSK